MCLTSIVRRVYLFLSGIADIMFFWENQGSVPCASKEVVFKELAMRESILQRTRPPEVYSSDHHRSHPPQNSASHLVRAAQPTRTGPPFKPFAQVGGPAERQ